MENGEAYVESPLGRTPPLFVGRWHMRFASGSKTLSEQQPSLSSLEALERGIEQSKLRRSRHPISWRIAV